MMQLHEMLEEWFDIGDVFSLIQVVLHRLNHSVSGRSDCGEPRARASERQKNSLHILLT